ncbi:predicted protein [Lichtheimia corymbifera JMRC:FSU:9682]|uniref:BAG family molecular chaperone regulator 1 n=1 Tax=Lichtheimia corymbifera JMRC:FSU:9682 TaxID=1263082 RepID=A0A068RQZ4_9FUNG|nr:predicted protein [Lichtheimia corymbifera JMRC:FSU:9682]
MATIEVKWQGRRFNVEFDDSELETATVHDLKDKCQKITNIEPARMKLLAYGAVMKNDSLSLNTYGIRSGSKVILMATPAADTANVDSTSAKSQEDQVLSRIQAAISKLTEEIVPDIDAYEQRVKEYMSAGGASDAKDPKQQRKLVDYGTWLNEQLMHILFDFDGILCDSSFEKARQQRKSGVHQCQALLERVDNIKALIKSHL